MNNVYYVQRLLKPRSLNLMLESFSFGGGLVNGGFRPEAMKLLMNIMSFDYMGSAEFEWGAVPRAFESLFTNPNIIKSQVIVGAQPVYFICPSAIEEDVHNWIALADKKEPSLKESLRLKGALSGNNNIVGWIKIEGDDRCEEPFMFFLDKEMFDNTCNLFGIK